MRTELSENVKVGVIFESNAKHIKPVWFIRGLRRHSIQEVTYTWKAMKGQNFLYYFSVMTPEGDLYELCYNAGSLSWTLEAVETDG